MKPQEYAILIIGLGNPLMGDDGVGVAVIAELEAVKWPAGVFVMDGGTSAISCLSEISHAEVLIAVDAVRAEGRPGSVYRLKLAEPGKPDGGCDRANCDHANCDHANWNHAGRAAGLGWSGQGSHGLSLPSVVALARSLTGMPREVVVFGVEPLFLELTTGLSVVVKGAIPRVVREIQADVRRILGHPQ